MCGPLVHEERPHQFDHVGERQPVRHATHQLRQLLAREEHAREEHHRREHQREVVGEEVVALGQGVEDERDAREHHARQQQDGPGDQQLRAVADAQRQHHPHDRRHGEERLERGPEHLGQHHVVQADGGVHDAVPGLLHVHARERGVERLEARRVHRAHADRAAGQEQDVGHRAFADMHLAHERAHAVAEGHQPHQRLGDVAQQARHRELAPYEQVAKEDGPPARAGRGRAPVAGHGRRGRVHGIGPGGGRQGEEQGPCRFTRGSGGP